MKRLVKLVAFLVLVGGWPLALSAIHVVRTSGQLPVVGSMAPNFGNVQIFTKEKLGFRQTFADTRKWTADDVANRPELVSRMNAIGLGDFARAAETDPVVPTAAPAPAARPPLSLPASGVPWDVNKPVKVIDNTAPHSSPATQPTAQKDSSIFNFGKQ